LNKSPHGWSADALGVGGDPDWAHVTVMCGDRGWGNGGDGTRLPIYDAGTVRASLVYEVPARAFGDRPESTTRWTRARVHTELRRVLREGHPLWALPGGVVAVGPDETQTLLWPSRKTTVVGGDGGDPMTGTAISLTHGLAAIRAQTHFRIDPADGRTWTRTRHRDPDTLTGPEVAGLITDLMVRRPYGGATVEADGTVHIVWGRGTQAARYVPVDVVPDDTAAGIAGHPEFRPEGDYSEHRVDPDGTESPAESVDAVTGADVARSADSATELVTIDARGVVDTRTKNRQGQTTRRRYRPLG